MKNIILNNELMESIKYYNNMETLDLLISSNTEVKKAIINKLSLSKEGGFFRHLKNEYVYEINKSHRNENKISSLLLINDLLPE